MNSKHRGKYVDWANDSDYFSKTEFFDVPLVEYNKTIESPANQTNITKRYTEKAA